MENMEQEQQMTVGELMNLIWTHYSDLKVNNPQWWEILMENLTSTENDQEALPTEDLKTLISFLMKIIKCWKMNSATWRVDSYEKLAERSSKLVGLTFRTSLPVIHPKKLIDLVESLLPQEDSIEEDSFASVSTKTTSMSSMTAPTQTIRVGAKFAKGTEIKDNIRPALRKRVPIGRLKERDWYNILKYFTTDGRRCKLLVLRGAVRGLPAGIENLESSRYRRNTLERMVETCTGQGGAELQQGLQIRYERGKGIRGRFEAHKSARKSRVLLPDEKIQEKLRMYPTCPIIAIIDTDPWLKDKDLMLLRADDKRVKNNVDAWSLTLCRWTFEDFNAFYKRKDCYPIFMAGYIPFEETYYTITESIDVLEKLLYFQFDGDEDDIRNFLYQLYNVLERKTPKLNTLLISSPASAGKNFFIDVFVNYLLNRGQFMMANRNNNFPFQQAHGKRVLIWDEPNYESSMTDTLKMICGGGSYNVNVKNKDSIHVFRTPVIILTNKHIEIMSAPEFKDRIVQFKWKTAPLLKDYVKLPNPLAAFELLVKWNIIKDNVIIE